MDLRLPPITERLAAEYLDAVLGPRGGLTAAQRATAVRNVLLRLPDRAARCEVLERRPAARRSL
jgi:hypothetical protein